MFSGWVGNLNRGADGRAAEAGSAVLGGVPVKDDRGSLDEPLNEQVQRQNTNLQSLIETITQMIAASRDLLRSLGGAKGDPPPDAQP